MLFVKLSISSDSLEPPKPSDITIEVFDVQPHKSIQDHSIIPAELKPQEIQKTGRRISENKFLVLYAIIAPLLMLTNPVFSVITHLLLNILFLVVCQRSKISHHRKLKVASKFGSCLMVFFMALLQVFITIRTLT